MLALEREFAHDPKNASRFPAVDVELPKEDVLSDILKESVSEFYKMIISRIIFQNSFSHSSEKF